jgi:hypothetical protein
MRVKTLRMISLSSLAAFSQGATAAMQARESRPVSPPGGATFAAANATQAAPQKPALQAAPPVLPGGPLPRGSLLNLTV